MSLHRVHAHDETMSNLAVGGALKQQPQHVALTLGQRFQERTGASGGKRKIRDVLLAKGGEQGSDVLRYDTAPAGVAQQGLHRCTLVDEETNIALWCGEHEHSFQGGEGARPISLCLQGQRSQHEDFQHAAQAGFSLGILEQPIQQVQHVLEERTCRFVAPLCDAHPCQSQVRALAGIAQLVIVGR